MNFQVLLLKYKEISENIYNKTTKIVKVENFLRIH